MVSIFRWRTVLLILKSPDVLTANFPTFKHSLSNFLSLTVRYLDGEQSLYLQKLWKLSHLPSLTIDAMPESMRQRFSGGDGGQVWAWCVGVGYVCVCVCVCVCLPACRSLSVWLGWSSKPDCLTPAAKPRLPSKIRFWREEQGRRRREEWMEGKKGEKDQTKELINKTHIWCQPHNLSQQ